MDNAAEFAIQLVRNLVRQFPLGCACYQAVFGENGEIADFVIIEINASFEELAGLKQADVAGRRVTESFKSLKAGAIERLRDIGNEACSNPSKAVVRRVSFLSRVYKVTVIFVSDSLMLGIYEDIRAQVYRKYHRRSIPFDIIAQSISEKRPARFDAAGRCSDGNASEFQGVPDCGEGGDEGSLRVCSEPCELSEEGDAVFRDSLTGLYDRLFAIEAMRMYIAQGMEPLSVALGDVNGLKMINDALGYQAGDQMLINIAQVLQANCREEDLVARWGDDEFLLLLPHASGLEAQAVLQRLQGALEKECRGNHCTTLTFGYATSEENPQNAENLIEEAYKWVHRKKLLESKSYRNNVIKLLLSTLHVKSAETQEHSDRMAAYCQSIAARLELSDEMTNDLLLLAMLHDIGKVAIPHQILNKPGPLTPEERREIEHHPEIGSRITKNIPELSQVSKYILAHHEWWDGSGYPNGLRGEEIPLPSRIIAAVDAYDVIISGRVYRAARSKQEAIAELRRCAGTQFDPKIIGIFTAQLEDAAPQSEKGPV